MKFIYGLTLDWVLTLESLKEWHETMTFCFGGTFCSQLEATARTLQFLDLGITLQVSIANPMYRAHQEWTSTSNARQQKLYSCCLHFQPYDKLNFSFLFSCPAASPIPQCQRCVCDSDDRNESKKDLTTPLNSTLKLGASGRGEKQSHNKNWS